MHGDQACSCLHLRSGYSKCAGVAREKKKQNKSAYETCARLVHRHVYHSWARCIKYDKCMCLRCASELRPDVLRARVRFKCIMCKGFKMAPNMSSLAKVSQVYRTCHVQCHA